MMNTEDSERVSSPRGRYAPSPTGDLHLGNARTALVAWLSVRAARGQFVLRMEDLDPDRSITSVADSVLDDLYWLGLDWDEGPDVGGPHGPYLQSARNRFYDEALQTLHARCRLFPCSLSRKALREIAVAPHSGVAERTSAYPISLRPANVRANWFDERFESVDGTNVASVRFAVDSESALFDDLLLGPQTQDPANEVGDFVVQRRDGVFAYQLAVVVDDIAMQIDEVVRGVDLLDSTGRQVQLLKALGGRIPSYGHVPLVLTQDGRKLSKREGGSTIASLRAGGMSPERTVGHLAFSLGLRPTSEPCNAASLIDDFLWASLSTQDWRLEGNSKGPMD